MLSDEAIERVNERIVRRIEKANLEVIKTIADNVGKLRSLTPTEAHKLVQTMRYGSDYDKILKEISKVSKVNKKEIEKIFEEVAKNDYKFAKKFYEYRKKKYIPYERTPLKRIVDGVAKMTNDEYDNLTRTIAFRKTVRGKVQYEPIGKTYHRILDEAVMNLGPGQDTFDTVMRRTLKELTDSGIRTVSYESGRSLRIDSAVRMQLRTAQRTLHNEIQEQIGKEIDADGVRISVHAAPAPDHEEVQGHDFSTVKPENDDTAKSEWEKLQEEGIATDVNGQEIDIHRTLKDGTVTDDYRPISTMNCYHVIESIVIGVNKPRYSQEQLDKIIKDNHKGFKYEGQKYTLYEGTQRQRQMEIEIRRLKDEQIAASRSKNEEWIEAVESEINTMTRKYVDFSRAGNLPTKMERLEVPGYKEYKTNR